MPVQLKYQWINLVITIFSHVSEDKLIIILHSIVGVYYGARIMYHYTRQGLLQALDDPYRYYYVQLTQ